MRDAAAKAVRLGEATGQHAPPFKKVGPRQQMPWSQRKRMVGLAFKQIEPGHFDQPHPRVKVRVRLAGNYIDLVARIHQRFAQVLDINALAAAIGVAAVAEQADAQRAGCRMGISRGCRSHKVIAKTKLLGGCSGRRILQDATHAGYEVIRWFDTRPCSN